MLRSSSGWMSSHCTLPTIVTAIRIAYSAGSPSLTMSATVSGLNS